MNIEKILREKLNKWCKSDWSLAKWQKRPALVSRDGSEMALYTGQKYDRDKYELAEDIWDHDHCELCTATISNDGYKDELQEAYSNGTDWLCPKCYERYIVCGEDITI